MTATQKKVCGIGAGPCGMSALWNFANKEDPNAIDLVCFEKQSTWGGLWNFTWRTGTDEFGEPCHGVMYKHLWSNGPKECLEFPDYTFEKHFGKAIPSFPPRAVLRDYLEGRWTRTSKVDLTKYIRFNTVVRHVKYNDADDTFSVDVINLKTNTFSTESFTHVIVAVGIFNTPNVPSFPGLESFEGRVLHAHDFRDAKEFKDRRLLIVGASYSAEDIALQCLKYGAKSVICTWRTKPIGFKWPEGIEERPLVQKFDEHVAYFKDESTAEVDAVILCTGYLYSFPFMEERLRLKSSLTLYPDNLYKGTIWLCGGNNKLFYLGVEDQYYTFTMFDVLALWTCKYILGKLENEPKTLKEMQLDAQQWVEKRAQLKNPHDEINFQSEFVGDLSKATGYSSDATKARKLFHDWERYKDDSIVTYRDQRVISIFTGKTSPKHDVSWWKAFDDSIAAFCKLNKK